MNIKKRWGELLSPKRTVELKGLPYSSSKESADVRSEIERDYGRAVFASAVRRLQDKAQVFPLEPSDFVRTRLTHSLEVSTIARGLVARLQSDLLDRGVTPQMLREIELVAATGGLLHDLGNPPFGHSGERAISGWFKSLCATDSNLVQSLGGTDSAHYRDFQEFDGNAQTLRLVTRLQQLADSHGLNLTAAVLCALQKYTARSTSVDKTKGADRAKAKLGVFQSESSLMNAAADACGLSDSRHPLTYIIEAADDIVYACVDLEDGVRKGVLRWEHISKALADLTEGLPAECEDRIRQGGLLSEGRDFEEACTQLLRTRLIGRLIDSASEVFSQRHDEILNGAFQTDLLHEGSQEEVLAACKDLAKTHVFSSQTIIATEVAGFAAIKGLMDLFWRAVSSENKKDAGTLEGKLYKMISSNYRLQHERAPSDVQQHPQQYRELQLVTDYVSGMTDTFALQLYRQLHGY